MEKENLFCRYKRCSQELPIVKLNDDVSIASFVILGDCEVVVAAAEALKDKLPKADFLMTAEAKGISLTHELARIMGFPRYIVARKSVKGYMEDPFTVDVSSITTKEAQTLCLDGVDAKLIKGKKVVIVDDVISTGESVKAVRKLAESAGAEVIAEAAILTEGNEEDHKNVISLGNIPLF